MVLDPLYSTHDQDENDTRAMAALCQSPLRLRDASGAALVVVHHVRKSIGRHEIGSAFRGSSALHAVGDTGAQNPVFAPLDCRDSPPAYTCKHPIPLHAAHQASSDGQAGKEPEEPVWAVP